MAPTCPRTWYEVLWRPCPTKTQHRCNEIANMNIFFAIFNQNHTWCNPPIAKRTCYPGSVWLFLEMCSVMEVFLYSWLATLKRSQDFHSQSISRQSLAYKRQVFLLFPFFSSSKYNKSFVILPGRWWKLLWEEQPRHCRGRKSSKQYTWKVHNDHRTQTWKA